MTTVLDHPDIAPEIQPTDDDRPPSAAGRPRRPRRRGRRLRWALLVLAVLLVPVGWSYSGYLRAPGDAPLTVRTSDFLRDHGFESVVNDVEQWWYTRKRPTGSRPPTGDIPVALRTVPAATPRAITTGTHPLTGEGVWAAVDGLVSRPGAVEQTWVRPDPRAPSVSAEIVRFDQQAVRSVLVPGTKEPGGAPWAWKSEIPTSQRPMAVAAFNAGFKFRHTPGGLYAEGRHAVRPLADGLASFVVRTDGTADVARWGRDATMGPDVVSVRQNLALIVDHGAPAPGLRADRGGNWGTRKSQFQYTWRSAVGVDAQGRLIYAAGSEITLTQMARAMVDAGAVRAMQLDIHDGVVTFNWYRPDAGSALHVTAQKLSPSMQRSATRYLAPDQRDFIAIEAR